MPAPVALGGLAVAALIEVLALFLILALMWLYHASLDKLLRALASHLTLHIKLPGYNHHFDFGKPFVEAANAMQDWLAAERDGLTIELGMTWHAMQACWTATAQAVHELATEVAGALDHIHGVTIPKWAKWAAAAAFPPWLIAKLVRAILPHIHLHGQKIVQVIEHNVVTHTVTRVMRAAVGGAVAFPPWVIRLPHRLRDLERDSARLGKRLRKVEGIFAAGVAAAVIANALGIATKCIRRGNVGKAARSICGFDPSLIESLLADGVAIIGAISVVEFAETMLALEDDAVKVLQAGIREFPG